MNRKNVFSFFILICIVIVSQFILAGKHLEMGFFTDDWLFISLYRQNVSNPILDIGKAWQEIGSHNFGYSYYIGILHGFFGLDYFAYRLTNQLLKIIATLSVYPLILYISKRKLVAFLATVIYGIHYSPFGLLDGPSRGGDFIAITLMNLFLAIYFYISKKPFNIYLFFALALWLLFTLLIGPTRLFPLLTVILLIELFKVFEYRTMNQIKLSLKKIAVLYSPFIFLFVFSPESILIQLGYSAGLFQKLREGNLQLLLIPFAALGSTYIPRNFWQLFGQPIFTSFSSYLEFLLLGPIFLSTIFFSLITFFISREPAKFIIRSILFNFTIGIVVYLISRNWLSLNPAVKTPVDPVTFLIPAIIGLFTVSACCYLFFEWKKAKSKNNLSIGIFYGSIFSLVFIILTWIFSDINSVFMGTHAYLNIPSIGTSIVISVILVLIYDKIRLSKALGHSSILAATLIFILIGSYFKTSYSNLDKYFSDWLQNGASAKDQQRILNQFWDEIGESKSFSKERLPLIYLDDIEEYENGAYYHEVITYRMSSWFDLKFKKNKEKRFQLCEIEISGKQELEKFLNLTDEGKIVNSKCGQQTVKAEDFYAFRLKGRNLVPMNKQDVLNQLEAK